MPSEDEPPAARASQLVKTYRLRRRPPVEALQSVDLYVPRGVVHGIVGRNGSGKSTLLRVFATLLLPDGGGAEVDGHDVVRSPGATRAAVGWSAGDERGHYLRLTGRQNLEFAAELRALSNPAEAVQRALDDADLADVADRPVSTYSQGMSRRLGLARALLHRPSLLLLDEPTRSLDEPSRAHLHDVLRREVATGTTVLLVTHDAAEASALCAVVAVLDSGRIVDTLDAPPAEAVAKAVHG